MAQANGHRDEQAQGRRDPGKRAKRKLPCARHQDRAPDQQKRQHPDQQDPARARQHAAPRATIERRRAHPLGLCKRPHGKDQRGQQAVERSLGHRAGIKSKRCGKWHGSGNQGGRKQNAHRTKRQPGQNTHTRQQAHLNEVNAENEATFGAQRLQGRDDGHLAFQPRPHGA